MSRDEQICNVLDCLNSAIQADPIAMNAVICNYHPCNKTLADHPHVTVTPVDSDKGIVGTLGVINGILTVLELPKICAEFTDDHKLIRFLKLKK